MLFFVLAVIDVLASLLGLYSLISGLFLELIMFLMIIVLVKGAWSVFSYPMGLIGWLDIITPLSYFFSFIGWSWVLSYIALVLLLGKGLFSLMFYLK